MNYTSKYSEVLKYRGGIARRNLRDLVLRTKTISTKKPSPSFKGIQFLYFHYLFDDEIDNAKKIIKWLATNYKVISYSEAVNRLLNDEIDDYYICFSSDDGLKNNLKAADIFDQYNISCCFFVNPAVIDSNDEEFKRKVTKQTMWLPDVQFLNWTDLKELQKRGHEIGDHSYEHKILVELSKEEMISDLEKSTTLFKRHLSNVVHYAFPRGLFHYFSKEYKDLVHDSGYLSCATASRGCHIKQGKEILNRDLSIRRDVLVFKEPLSYIKYFMTQSQNNSGKENSFWKE